MSSQVSSRLVHVLGRSSQHLDLVLCKSYVRWARETSNEVESQTSPELVKAAGVGSALTESRLSSARNAMHTELVRHIERSRIADLAAFVKAVGVGR